MKGEPIDSNTRERIVQMATQNVARPEIARALQVSKSTISRILKNGVDRETTGSKIRR